MCIYITESPSVHLKHCKPTILQWNNFFKEQNKNKPLYTLENSSETPFKQNRQLLYHLEVVCFGIYSRKVKVYVPKKTLYINVQNGLLCNQNLDATQVSFSRWRASSQHTTHSLSRAQPWERTSCWDKRTPGWRPRRLGRAGGNKRGLTGTQTPWFGIYNISWNDRTTEMETDSRLGGGTWLSEAAASSSSLWFPAVIGVKSGWLSLGAPGWKGTRDLCVISYNCMWIYNHL